MTEHTIKQFDADLEAIRTGVLTMGGMVTDKSERTIVGDKDRPIAVTNLDELTDEELAAIAMGEA